jgi:signal transduction histidine kinase/ActR/RegA family two-component response regulator
MSSKPTYEELEKRVRELEQAESARKRAENAFHPKEAFLETQLKFCLMIRKPIGQFVEFVLEKAVELTGSKVGCFGFINDNGTVQSIHGWSGQARQACEIAGTPLMNAIQGTGLWNELVRCEGPIVVNDLANGHDPATNIPIGRMGLKRYMAVPVFGDEKIVAIACVGDKQTAYDDTDVRRLTMLLQGMWPVVQQQRNDTARCESEEKLERMRKMESLGLLAGGVAHDLNNILSGIIGYPEIILTELPKDSHLRTSVQMIQDCGRRAVETVQDLLTIARGAALATEPLDLNSVVDMVLDSPGFKKLEQSHPAATVDIDLSPGLLHISGSRPHIKKVIMNLMTNAFEAISKSGKVMISTANRYVDKPVKGYDDVIIGEYVVLSVADNGEGISPNDIERIFEPFYTKKYMNRRSTGLGLAVVWNVVQEHKGYIDVSADENGTTFDLYFPITRDDFWRQDTSFSCREFDGKGETVLVVDDEVHQRELLCRMSNMFGYKAKSVASGEEAVTYMKDNKADLILLDMIMAPGINGRETYERILQIHPGQKAIIVSGYAETEEVRKVRQLGVRQYIRKPVEIDKLWRAMRSELGTKIS